MQNEMLLPFSLKSTGQINHVLESKYNIYHTHIHAIAMDIVSATNALPRHQVTTGYLEVRSSFAGKSFSAFFSFDTLSLGVI